MAKGGAAKGPSKKAVDKAKAKIIEDKTFGLKNKGKSKKVQQHVSQVKNVVNQVHDKRVKKEQEEREKKRLMKLEMKKREEELKALFKSADPEKKDAGAEVVEEEPAEEDLYEQFESEIEDEEDMSIEDIIEKERAKIVTGTPVTFESFTKWKEFKLEQQRKEEERRKKLARETGMLTGRDLFEYNQSLFVDDTAAGGAEDYARDDDVDESLFLDEDDDEPQEAAKEEVAEYNPATWTGNKTPKDLLQDYFNDKKWPLPKYECIQVANGFNGKLTTMHDKKEVTTPTPFPNKKLAEQNIALQVYRQYTKSVFK